MLPPLNCVALSALAMGILFRNHAELVDANDQTLGIALDDGNRPVDRHLSHPGIIEPKKIHAETLGSLSSPAGRMGRKGSAPTTTEAGVQLPSANAPYRIGVLHAPVALVADSSFPRELNIRARRQYNYLHTYATMCPIAGMNPAFIANQFGHFVQMLLPTYAQWTSSSVDWNEPGKLESKLIGTQSVQTATVPL